MNKKFVIQTNPDDEDVPVVALALRSMLPGLATGDDGCEEALTNMCYVECSVPLEINGGDIVYNVGMTPFDGDNKYFNLALQLWDISEGTRVCQIDPDGVILGVYSICVI